MNRAVPFRGRYEFTIVGSMTAAKVASTELLERKKYQMRKESEAVGMQELSVNLVGKAVLNRETDRELEGLAEAVRSACLSAALEAYEDASIRGVCGEGAWECAIGAIRSLDIGAVVERWNAEHAPHEEPK